MNHAIYIVFLFALGACVGSFLNVVVWRLPRGESLVTPPSHCPTCNTPLAWYDNIPVLGWLLLRGKCRYCGQPISRRYPIVEAVTGALFVFYYVMLFVFDAGPCAPRSTAGGVLPPMGLSFGQDWPLYGLYVFLVAALLAASLIDAELMVIPVEIPWLVAVVAILFHTLLDHPRVPGSLSLVDRAGAPEMSNALAAGGGVGLLISVVLWRLGRIPTSFPDGEPLLEMDRAAAAAELEAARREGKDLPPLPPAYTRAQIRGEIGKEMLFLLPPMLGAFAWVVLSHTAALQPMWQSALRHDWLTGLLGAVLGALVGAFVVWVTRILGTLVFGRVAMGLGDVHLMFGVGAALGAGAVTVAFFLAPFFGIAVALYMLLSGTRRELPYGPYLSLAAAFVVLSYCPIANYLRPGMEGLADGLSQLLHGG